MFARRSWRLEAGGWRLWGGLSRPPASDLRPPVKNKHHTTMTTIKINAFSRVRLNAPIVAPRPTHGRHELDPDTISRLMIQIARVVRKASSAVFWSSPSKKIAGG